MSFALLPRALATAIGFAALTLAAIVLSRIDGPTALVWPVNAAFIALLLLTDGLEARIRVMAFGMAGVLVGNMISGTSFVLSAIFIVANSGEILLALAAAQTLLMPSNIERVQPLRYVKALAALAFAPLISATIAAAALAMTFPESGEFSDFLLPWYLADFLGLFLLGPVFYALFSRGIRRIGAYAGGIACGAAVVALAMLVSSEELSKFVILAGAVITALFGLPVAVGMIIGVLSGFLIANSSGLDIPSVTATGLHLIDFQLLLVAVTTLSLIVAFVVERRRELSEQLHASMHEREANFSALQQLQEGVNQLSDALVIYDRDDRLVYCNDAYRAVYPASASAIVPGATFESILRHGLENGQYDAAIGREEDWLAERLEIHRQPESQTIQNLNDGRWLRVREVRMASGGHVGFRVDITEMKNLENHLREERERAVAANAAKDVFLANMSHEIRTPLNGVLGMSQALSASPLSPSQARMNDAILKSGDTLLRLLNDLLDLARIESGAMDFAEKTFTPASVIDAQVLLFSESAVRKGITLTFDDNGLDPRAEMIGDPGRLGQVLSNLIGNAIKFTDTGGVTVTAHLDDFAEPDHMTLRVSVRDTGKGIEADRRDVIFERFQQEDETIAYDHGGAGLGLSICKMICDHMNGEISCHQAPGGGSDFSFTVSLPVRKRAVSAA